MWKGPGVYITWMCPRADARATTLRWDLTSKQASLTKQNRAVCLLVSAFLQTFLHCKISSKQEKTGGLDQETGHTDKNRAELLLSALFQRANHIRADYIVVSTGRAHREPGGEEMLLSTIKPTWLRRVSRAFVHGPMSMD